MVLVGAYIARAKEYVSLHHPDFDVDAASCSMFISLAKPDSGVSIYFGSGMGHDMVSVTINSQGQFGPIHRAPLVD